MARYEHLPIYKKSMDLTIYFEKIVRNFSRYHKYTMGSELRDKSRAIVGLIIKANSTVERLAILKKGSQGWPEFPAVSDAGERAEIHHGASAPPFRHECSGGMYPSEEGIIPRWGFSLKIVCIKKRRDRSGQMSVQSSNYWSATTNANNTTNAWNVNFNNGNVNNNDKTNNNYVWCVRGGA